MGRRRRYTDQKSHYLKYDLTSEVTQLLWAIFEWLMYPDFELSLINTSCVNDDIRSQVNFSNCHGRH